MMSVFKRFIYLVVIALLVSVTCVQSAVHAEAYTPRTGVLFNNPAGTQSEQYILDRHLNQMIDNAPAGSIIRFAFYSGGVTNVSDTIIAAHRRGVQIRMIMNGNNAKYEWWHNLEREVGTDISKGSYATVCPNSCFDTVSTSQLHAKYYLFSQVGSAQDIAVIASGNPSIAQAEKGFNNMYTMVGNETMFVAYRRYFDTMARSSRINDVIDYSRTVASGRYTTMLSPGQSTATQNYYQGILDNISCKAGAGYGRNGRTVVRVIMSLWTSARIYNAERLRDLRRQGCYVEVIVAAHGTSRDVLKELTTPTANGSIIVRNSSKDLDGNGTIDRYTHEKVVMVNGGYNGHDKVKSVWMGSHNFTISAMRNNNDIILRDRDEHTYDVFNSHFIWMRTYAPIMKRVAQKTTADSELVGYEGMSAAETTPFADLETLDASGE